MESTRGNGSTLSEEGEKRIIEVVVPLPVDHSFHYLVPEHLRKDICTGKRVLVPFRSRKIEAYCTGFSSCELKELKEVLECLDDEPIFSDRDLEFYRWASKYYITSLWYVLRSALPAGLHIGGKEKFMVTEEGLKASISMELDPLTLSILNFVKAKEPVSLSSILRKFPEKGVHSIFRRLQKKKWICPIEEGSFRRKTRPKEERIITLTEKGMALVSSKGNFPRIRVGYVQKEILKLLSEVKSGTVEELRKIFPGISEKVGGLLKKGLIEVSHRAGDSNSISGAPLDLVPEPLLNLEQRSAIERIKRAINARSYRAFLLFGVTGSGKTEVYIQAMKEAIKQGRKGILLVPEISLTHQLVMTLRARFGKSVALLHSRLSSGERLETWKRIKRGEVNIVVGARSALFAPIDPIGIICVDEEHDSSFKQEEGFRYHARDLAMVRAKLSGAVVVLGSATPSLETYYNVKRKKVQLLKLTRRIDDRPLPSVEIVDLKKECTPDGKRPILSNKLIDSIRENIDRGEGTLLFLNRRGFSSFLMCPDCGFVFRCKNCSVSLVHHMEDRSVRCHYCDYRIPASPLCPSCKGYGVRDMGMGTEGLEKELKALFPYVYIARMDSDTMSSKKAQNEILKNWTGGKIDILTGTQLIAKGHHIPKVTLVGVVLADISLNIPDFRAAERTFQLLTQVAGRAGRGEKQGKVIIQTYNPEHYSIIAARDQDFVAFFDRESALRKELGYPPFWYLVNIRISGTNESKTSSYVISFGELCRELLKKWNNSSASIVFLGPSPAPIFKLRGRYRWHMLLKSQKRGPLNQLVRHLIKEAEMRLPKAGLQVSVDVDPVSMV